MPSNLLIPPKSRDLRKDPIRGMTRVIELEPETSLLCYKALTAPGTPKFRGPPGPVYVDNQFGASTFTVDHQRELCVPATIGP